MADGWKLATFPLPPFLFFSSRQFYPCESDRTPFSTIDLRIFTRLHPSSRTRISAIANTSLPVCLTYLSTSCRRSLGGRGRGARGNVIDPLAGEEAKDRYGGTSSPVAAVVNRYPGCLICIHPGTRASQRLERYSKGGRFPCSPRVSLRVFVCNSSRFPLFVLSALSLLLPIIPRSKPPGFLPSSFHLTFCAISPRFSSSCNDPRSCRGAAFHFCRREVIVSNRAKPAIRLASAAASMVVASAPCSSHGVTAHSVANRDRERLAPGLSFRVTRVTRVP